MAKKLTGYDLSRVWFDWCFENPDLINPNHGALYFFCIEHCNRLGWKDKFGLPSTLAMDAIGVKSYNTYSKTLKDLIEWGFISMVQKSKNQYTANIIALSYYTKALDKALDKAILKHLTDQGESKDSIDKPLTIKPLTIEHRKLEFASSLEKYLGEYGRKLLDEFYEYWTEKNENGKKMRFEKETVFEIAKRLVTWKNRQKNFNHGKKPQRAAVIIDPDKDYDQKL